jgi:hypothetical protein
VRARDAAKKAAGCCSGADGREKARTLDALNAKATTQATAKPADLREAYTASAQASGLSAQSSHQVAHGMDSAAEATRRQRLRSQPSMIC